LTDAGYAGLTTRVTSEDSFIPLGPAANAVLLDEPTIEKAAVGLPARGLSADYQAAGAPGRVFGVKPDPAGRLRPGA